MSERIYVFCEACGDCRLVVAPLGNKRLWLASQGCVYCGKRGLKERVERSGKEVFSYLACCGGPGPSV